MRSVLQAIRIVLLATTLLLSLPAGATEVCGTGATAPGPDDGALRRLAETLGIRAAAAFVGTADSLFRSGRLPSCYLTKRAAEGKGWRPGADLWNVAPGAAIGGDRFGNREGALPADGNYREADLDYAGGHRGAARLIYSEASAGRWRAWVTVDHYRSFHPLPSGP